MFMLKKIIGMSLQPFTLIMLASLLGLVLLWFSRRQTLSRVLLSLGLVTLLLLSCNPVANTILLQLESQYRPYTPKTTIQPKYMVVLGGGIVADPDLPVSSQINLISLARVVEGIRIFRQHPGSILLFSGGTVFDSRISEARIMADTAQLLGVPAEAIRTESQSWDTSDQAIFVKKMLGNARFVLVTSAVHLPRSMLLFREAGMDPIPGPANYLVRHDQQIGFNILDLFPRPENLLNVSSAVHEYLGILWIDWRKILAF